MKLNELEKLIRERIDKYQATNYRVLKNKDGKQFVNILELKDAYWIIKEVFDEIRKDNQDN